MFNRSIYSWKGLDKSILFTILGVTLIAATLLAFTLADNSGCKSFALAVKGSVYHKKNNYFYLNEKLDFSVLHSETYNVSWDFGDKTEPVRGRNVSHKFVKEGDYLVTAIVNNTCKEFIAITIRDPKTETINPPVMIGDVAIMPATDSSPMPVDEPMQNVLSPLPPLPPPNVGKNAFNELPKSDAVVADVKPKEQSTGEKPIKQQSTSQFEALPQSELKEMLEDVVEGKLTVDDFKTYVCQGGDTKVLANGKYTTLSELFTELRKIKKTGFILKNKKNTATISFARGVPEKELGNKCFSLIEVEFKYSR